MACVDDSAMGLCEEDADALCSHLEKCGSLAKGAKGVCLGAVRKQCDEKKEEFEKFEENCKNSGGILRHGRASCTEMLKSASCSVEPSCQWALECAK
jgi:hypothetical protein